MKLALKTIVPLLAVAALAAACNPFAHKTSAPQYPKDSRFSEFVFKSDETPTVKDRTDSVNVRWPNTNASEAHIVTEYSSQTGFLPDQDPEFWLTAVATVPDETIQLLADSCPESILISTSTYPRSASSPRSTRSSRTRHSHRIKRRSHTISAPWTYKRWPCPKIATFSCSPPSATPEPQGPPTRPHHRAPASSIFRGRGHLLCTQNHRKTEKRKLILS